MISAKEVFFKDNHILDDNSRKRGLVYARAAFAMAFRCVAGPSLMGKILGRDHATIVHYSRLHFSLIKYDDYNKLFEYAVIFRETLFKKEDIPTMTHSDLIRVIKGLRQELREEKEKNQHLYIYKEKFFKLKALI